MVKALIKKEKKRTTENKKEEEKTQKKGEAKTSGRGTNVDTDLLYTFCLQVLYRMTKKNQTLDCFARE